MAVNVIVLPKPFKFSVTRCEYVRMGRRIMPYSPMDCSHYKCMSHVTLYVFMALRFGHVT